MLGDCVYIAGKRPEPGSCTGPEQRALAKRAAINDLNYGCAMVGSARDIICDHLLNEIV
jgi:hypothetical protein